MTRPGVRFASAAHEAAHAVVADALGFELHDCRIYDDGGGITKYYHALRDRKTEMGCHRLLSVVLAGKVGEWVKLGRAPLAPHEGDDRGADELLAIFPEHERDDVRSEAIVRAELLIEQQQPLFDRLTDCLHMGVSWRNAFAIGT